MKLKTTYLLSFILVILFYSEVVKADSIPVVNQTLVINKLHSLKLHRVPYGNPASNNFQYQIFPITDSVYQLQKPATALSFDAGYVTNVGNFYFIYVSKPTSATQIAAFANDDKAVLYYLCEAYLSFFYQTTQMPKWFKCAFASYEARLSISDSTIKVALNNYGNSITDFSVLNDTANFRINNGLAVSYMFGEYMCASRPWEWQNIYQLTSQNFDVVPWWFGVNSKDRLLFLWNRYLNARIKETDENLRIKLNLETAHFQCYFRNVDNYCFPDFINTLENAYVEYCSLLDTQAYEKLTYFTLPECPGAALLDTLPCPNRVTGGTAWSSGVSTTCANNVGEIPMFLPLLRHELAHTFQGLIGQGTATAWFNEGFPSFFDRTPLTTASLNQLRPAAISAMDSAYSYFGHSPTFDNTWIYPNYYDYYTCGLFELDYIYRKGGYQAIINVAQHDTLGFLQLGFNTPDHFMRHFYFDFDTRVRNYKLVSLVTPNIDSTYSSSTMPIHWTPLDSSIVLDVAVSLNNDSSWTNIVTNTTQTTFQWNTGGFFGKFWLKFTAPEDLNISTVFGPFLMVDPLAVTLMQPNNSNMVVGGDTLLIKWANCQVPNINILYTLNNGNSWQTACNNVPVSTLSYKWVVPDSASTQCKIKIVSSANNLVFDQSDTTFTIVKENPVGGPYRLDTNTIVLLHFNDNLNNESSLTADAVGFPQNITYQNSMESDLGKDISSTATLTIPHNSHLNLTGDFTIELWLKLTAFTTTNYQYFLQKPGDNDSYLSNYALQVNPWWGNCFYGFYFANDTTRIGASAGVTTTLNQWYHLALIRDTLNHELRLLVHDNNRNLVSANTQPYTNAAVKISSQDLKIFDNVFGAIDELRISNVIRSLEDINVAVPEFSVEKTPISIYPNPASDRIYVNGPANEKINISVYNIVGACVLQKELNNSLNVLNISMLPKGLYVIKVRGGDVSKVLKFVKE